MTFNEFKEWLAELQIVFVCLAAQIYDVFADGVIGKVAREPSHTFSHSNIFFTSTLCPSYSAKP